MSRTYGLASLGTFGAILAGWAAVALAQSAGDPPAPVPVPVVQNGAPAPIPVMPSTPGALPAPVAPAGVPQPASPAPVATNEQAAPTAPVPTPAPSPAPAKTAELHTGTTLAADAGPPTGRQEPAVAIDWIGPPAVKVGQPTEYAVVVRNVCNAAVHQVLVRVRVPGNVNVQGTEPKAAQEDGLLTWEVGTLLPKQEKNLQIRLASAASGDINAQAWVTFTGASALRIRVREPKLVVKAVAPERIPLGDAANFVLNVSNPGDGTAEQVKLHAELSEGLEHPRGKKVSYELGNINPGETRTVQVICATKTAGAQICQVLAEGDGLKAQDKVTAAVTVPKIEVEAKGPKLRYLDRKAVYTFKVTNSGDAPAVNVSLTDAVPPGFKFVSATGGGRCDFATSTVSWFLGEIDPGQSREVNLEVMCVNIGNFAHRLTAQGARGLLVEDQVVTQIEGLSAILLEVVDLEDPVEVNADTAYEIRITNTGSKTEPAVKLACTIPDKMQFKAATGPSAFRVEGNEVIFEPLPKLAPRADAIYRVTVKCVTPGIAQFRAKLTSAILTDPVTKEEATRIYAD